MRALATDKIVLPVDFSGESGRAIDVALELAGGDAAKLHLIHVLFPLDNVSPGVVWGEISDEKRKEAIQHEFDALVGAKQIASATVVVRFGNPGLEIAEYAEQIGADLIVMPSHGYHGVKRLILGSVAERVIRHAKCSVLVLRRADAD